MFLQKKSKIFPYFLIIILSLLTVLYYISLKNYVENIHVVSDKVETVKIQALHELSSSKSVAKTEQVQQFIEKFEKAVEEVHKADNKDKHEAALANARKSYTDMYKFSTKHPFVLTEEQKQRVQKNLAILKNEYKKFLPEAKQPLLHDYHQAVQKLKTIPRTSKEYMNTIKEIQNRYEKIANFSMRHPLILTPEEQAKMDADEKYLQQESLNYHTKTKPISSMQHKTQTLISKMKPIRTQNNPSKNINKKY